MTRTLIHDADGNLLGNTETWTISGYLEPVFVDDDGNVKPVDRIEYADFSEDDVARMEEVWPKKGDFIIRGNECFEIIMDGPTTVIAEPVADEPFMVDAHKVEDS